MAEPATTAPKTPAPKTTAPKTTRNDDDVAAFLAGVADEKRRADAEAACELIAEVTGAAPTMWGSAIIGFGTYHYRYASGREGDWPAVGLSPRKQALTLYISGGFEAYADLMGRLGPHRNGKSCLYLKRLADVDQAVLRELVKAGFEHLNGRTLTSEPD
ncbi:DUF1801 domain-containing protein [Actinoplanes sp. GCM10030250]|uniref:DUF1801 domain-containing protein n=1 Tax=Actinoplanes sp. GCM10030250 TaxID=3273376 RepID=UPI003623394A